MYRTKVRILKMIQRNIHEATHFNKCIKCGNNTAIKDPIFNVLDCVMCGKIKGGR